MSILVLQFKELLGKRENLACHSEYGCARPLHLYGMDGLLANASCGEHSTLIVAPLAEFLLLRICCKMLGRLFLRLIHASRDS